MGNGGSDYFKNVQKSVEIKCNNRICTIMSAFIHQHSLNPLISLCSLLWKNNYSVLC